MWKAKNSIDRRENVMVWMLALCVMLLYIYIMIGVDVQLIQAPMLVRI